MRRLAVVAIRVCCCCAILVLGVVVLAGRLQAYVPSYTPRIDRCQDRMCFANVTAELTTWEDAKLILANYLDDQGRSTFNIRGEINGARFFLQPRGAKVGSIDIDFHNGRPTLTTGALILQHGIPCSVAVLRPNTLTLVYPYMMVFADLSGPDYRDDTLRRLTPDGIVTIVSVYPASTGCDGGPLPYIGFSSFERYIRQLNTILKR